MLTRNGIYLATYDKNNNSTALLVFDRYTNCKILKNFQDFDKNLYQNLRDDIQNETLMF